MDKAAKIALGIMACCMGLCLMPIGLFQLMPEGPHGPHGEITGDPGGPIRMRAICVTGVALLIVGGFAFNSARK